MLIINETLVALLFCTTISFQIDEVLVKSEFHQLNNSRYEVSIDFKNTSDQPVFLFLPKEHNYSMSTDTSVNFDIGSSYITDPLAFPKFKIQLRPIFPGETYEISRTLEGSTDRIKEFYIAFDCVDPAKATGRLQRKLKRLLRKKKSGMINLIDYYYYQEEAGMQYGKSVEC